MCHHAAICTCGTTRPLSVSCYHAGGWCWQSPCRLRVAACPELGRQGCACLLLRQPTSCRPLNPTCRRQIFCPVASAMFCCGTYGIPSQKNLLHSFQDWGDCELELDHKTQTSLKVDTSVCPLSDDLQPTPACVAAAKQYCCFENRLGQPKHWPALNHSKVL